MASRKYVLIGLAALASVVAVIALAVTLLSGDGEEKGLSAGDTPLSKEVAAAQQTATPVSPTATSVPPATTVQPELTPLPDRTSCEEIRGTDYRSEAERQFFFENCIPTPAPVAPTTPPQPVTPPSQGVSTPTIEGTWLLYDGVGWNAIAFDTSGNVLRYEPRERASDISGRGSIQGETMTFSYTAFDPVFGKSVSVSYRGTRVRDDQLAGLGLPASLAGVPVYFGQLQRSDLPGMPIAVAAIRR
jgi:hypothetical protein